MELKNPFRVINFRHGKLKMTKKDLQTWQVRAKLAGVAVVAIAASGVAGLSIHKKSRTDLRGERTQPSFTESHTIPAGTDLSRSHLPSYRTVWSSLAVVNPHKSDPHDLLMRVRKANMVCGGCEAQMLKAERVLHMVANAIVSRGEEDSGPALSLAERVLSRAAVSDFPLLTAIRWDKVKRESRGEGIEIYDLLVRRWSENRVFDPIFRRVPRSIDGSVMYGYDVGSPVPNILTQPVPEGTRTLDAHEEQKALELLKDDGFVRVSNLIDLDVIKSVRDKLHVKCPKVYQRGEEWEEMTTQEVDTEDVEEGDEECFVVDSANGRRHYLIRRSQYEALAHGVLRGIMPLIYRYMEAERSDTLLAKGSDAPKDATTPLKDILPEVQPVIKDDGSGPDLIPSVAPRLYISDMQMVVANPVAQGQFWHLDNGAGGLTVVVPLTLDDEMLGPLMVLPGSHHVAGKNATDWWWTRALKVFKGALTSSGPDGNTSITYDLGDAIIYSGKMIKRERGNRKYNRSKVYLVWRFDFTDTPPPGQNVFQTVWYDICGYFLDHLKKFYFWMPVGS
ncbi:hypothetical protein FOZ63_004951 [Perkinsus olseni]|uniref:Uncharacterized protein n=4 Tax=Perkinsus olseni TaxID=32597 RepID=A0A7J6P6W8_PEROL|nr:hypothetical protein FOZ63_004951 [Perkinsus olseni]